VLKALSGSVAGYVCLGFALLIPIVGFSGWRLRLLSKGLVGIGEGCRLVLIGSFLNLFLPARAGDLLKAAFARNPEGDVRIEMGGSILVEKFLDIGAFSAMTAFACLLVRGIPPGSAGAIIIVGGVSLFGAILIVVSRWRRTVPIGQRTTNDSGRAGKAWIRNITDRSTMAAREALSHSPGAWIVLWILTFCLVGFQIMQIVCFARAIAPAVPFAAGSLAAALTLGFAALPLSLGGFGSRDAALTFLFGAWMTRSETAALALICSARYIAAATLGAILLWNWNVDERASFATQDSE
jgi:uncharacterized membrane protein YbhN (UPF0104 family)